MRGSDVPEKVLVFQYKNHKFYADALDDSKPLVHIDPKGREISSDCLDEDEAMEVVDSLQQ